MIKMERRTPLGPPPPGVLTVRCVWGAISTGKDAQLQEQDEETISKYDFTWVNRVPVQSKDHGVPAIYFAFCV